MADSQPDNVWGFPLPQRSYPSKQRGPAYDPPTDAASQIAAAEQQLGLPTYYDQQAATFAQMELDSMAATGRTDPMGEIKLPPGVGWGDFFALATSVEAFSASAGQRYAPNQQQMNAMLAAGLATADQADVFKWLAKSQGIAGSMPWAAAGMTHTQYDATLAQMQDTIATYTGDPSMYGELASQAIAKGAGGYQWLHTQLTTNKAYTENAKTPWLQYGMQYQQFKDFKAKQVKSFDPGSAATDAQYAALYGNIQAGAKPQVSGATSVQPSAGGAQVGTGRQSQVR